MDAIVCDTSSLIRLYKCNTLPLVSMSFDRVFIPEAVWNECQPALHREFEAQRFIKIAATNVTISKFGLGEREMLNIAIEKNIQFVLTDDDKAAREAQRRSLTPLSALDILVLAKNDGANISIRSAVEIMTAKNERIEHGDFLQALIDAGES
jgi:predicted nucleic acid-binding protein